VAKDNIMTQQDFDNLIEYGKRCNIVNGKEIEVTQLPFKFIKWKFSQMIEQGLIHESVFKVLKYLKLDSNDLTSKQINSIFLYLYDEILTEKGLINQLEQKYLSSQPDANMIGAGANRLAPFNTLLTLYNLSNKDILKMNKIAKLPYQSLLDIQVMTKIENEVQSKYQELVLKKK